MGLRKLLWSALACLTAAPVPFAHAFPRHVDVVLHPGKIHEECFPLRPGQTLQYNFKLERPAKFNLHYHLGKGGKDVFYPIRSESVSEQKGIYVPSIAKEYCLMWTGDKDGENKLGYEFIVD